LAGGRRRPDPPAEEVRVDALLALEAPHPRHDLRRRAVRAPRQEAPVVGVHRDRVAGLRCALDPLHRAREHPRVPAQQRLLPAGFQYQLKQLRPMALTTRHRGEKTGKSETRRIPSLYLIQSKEKPRRKDRKELQERKQRKAGAWRSTQGFFPVLPLRALRPFAAFASRFSFSVLFRASLSVRQVMLSTICVWRAGARRRRPWRGAASRDGCRPGWWRCWRGRAFPGPRADPRSTAARGKRTSAAACAGGHEPGGPACGPRPARAAAPRARRSVCRAGASPAGSEVRAASHARSASSAKRPTGTTRVLAPLPTTRTVCSRKSTSPGLSEVSSESRSPEE